MARTTPLPYCKPLIEEDDLAAVREAMLSGWLSRGPKTAEFERAFAEYVGAKHAVGLNSCTAGLHLALVALGIGPGDEVITVPYTFCATVNVIEHVGAKPVLVDIDPDTFCLDPGKLEAAITPRTKAIMPVHYAGHPCDLDAIDTIARRHGLAVVEDAAHAVYTQYKGQRIGGHGHIACFSFYATKNLVTGEGGMLTCDDPQIAERVKQLALHGMSHGAWNRYSGAGSWYYEVEAPGFKYNMTDTQAALGLSQLAKLERMQAARARYAALYAEGLADHPALLLPTVAADALHAWHLYPLRLRHDRLSIDRARFIEELKARHIGTSVHFIPVHLHPYYRGKYGWERGAFPVAEAVYDSLISLPLYPAMSERDALDVVEAVREVADRFQVERAPAAVQDGRRD